jgi:hypothetical protein
MVRSRAEKQSYLRVAHWSQRDEPPSGWWFQLHHFIRVHVLQVRRIATQQHQQQHINQIRRPQDIPESKDADEVPSRSEHANNLDSASHFTDNSTSIDIIENRGFFFYTRTLTENNTTKPVSLLHGSKEIALTFYLFECSMHSIIVEANIICESGSCTVSRLRRLNTPRPNWKAKYLPYDVANDAYTNAALIRHIVAIGGDNYPFAMSNPIDTYIYGGAPWSVDETTGQAGVQN